MGGAADAQDVLEFMACGATVVAVGSCALRDPCLGWHSAEGLANLLDDRALSAVDLVGLAHRQA
jgi:dihydroorotate dehydrogenase